MRTISRWGAFVAAGALALGGCTGSSGPAGANGAPGPTGPTGPSGPTGPGVTSVAPVQARLWVKITKVTVPAAATTGGKPTVTYQLYLDAAKTQLMPSCKGGGDSGYGALSPNFTIAKLVADTANAGTKRWQSYINKTLTGFTVSTIEGGHDTFPGTLVDNGDGSCSYTYASDLSVKATPAAAAAVTETYEPNAITRFGLQDNPSEPSTTTPAFDGFVDVVPASGAIQTTDPRKLVGDEACNACHNQLAHHGAKRLSIGFCVSCHNAALPDPDPTSIGSTSLDMAVMIHKIHQGANLPSVSGTDLSGLSTGGGTTSLIVNGTNYTNVIFPQSTANCSVCHNQTSGAGFDYWKVQISIEACGACHDRTSFAASPPAGFLAHGGGAKADGTCLTCHAVGGGIAPTEVHSIAVPALSAQAATLTILDVASSGPGQIPVVHFQVTDPTSAGAMVNLATATGWSTVLGARLALDIGFTVKPGQDWTNTGSGAVTGFGSMVPFGSPAPGQPRSFDLLAGIVSGAVVRQGDGTYLFTAPVAIPAAAVGTGVAVLEGHPASATVAELPVRTGTLFFLITDTVLAPRRTVVDIQKCDKCHGMLTLHGGNRTDNIDACVVCHNTEATDVTQRPLPLGTAGIDGKTESSIDLATMVHSIHTGASPFSPGIVVYAFTGAVPAASTPVPVDFRTVVLPEGNSIGRCFICHADSNPLPNADLGIVNGVTQLTADLADQSTYTRTTRVTAVCSSCHGTSLAISHMEQNGGAFGVTQAQIDGFTGAAVETCTLCHGTGAAFDPAKFHGH